ncbi:MAG: outer membrane beta-barrel protein [Gammaproteobacteria bacterium]|nr:outer membrane beta-barrel protein [Gammaproteobacteria bacterium]
MKRIIALLWLFFMFFPVLSHAEIERTKGVYLGAGLEGMIHKEPLWTPLFMELGIHIRPYLGYRFSNYFALEASYDGFRHNSGSYDCYNFDLFDVAGKFFYPLSEHFDVYARGGLVYEREDVANDRRSWWMEPYHETHQRIAPTVGAGLMYYFNPHWSSDLFYIYIPPMGRNIASANIFGFGVTYSFGKIQ